MTYDDPPIDARQADKGHEPERVEEHKDDLCDERHDDDGHVEAAAADIGVLEGHVHGVHVAGLLSESRLLCW